VLDSIERRWDQDTVGGDVFGVVCGVGEEKLFNSASAEQLKAMPIT
jgi:hypothetical protein